MVVMMVMIMIIIIAPICRDFQYGRRITKILLPKAIYLPATSRLAIAYKQIREKCGNCSTETPPSTVFLSHRLYLNSLLEKQKLSHLIVEKQKHPIMSIIAEI
jgi:hypothetical protein